MMPPMRIIQRLSQSGDEAPPPSSTQNTTSTQNLPQSKPYHRSPRIVRPRPPPKLKKMSCFMRLTWSTLPLELSDLAKMPKAPAQARTMKASRTSRLCGHRHQHKSSKTMQVSTSTKSKTGRRKSQMTKL
jgi:hypothetical protein